MDPILALPPEVTILLTQPASALHAAPVAAALANAAKVPVSVVAPQMGASIPAGVEALRTQLLRAGAEVRVRMFVCRHLSDIVHLALRPHSLVVMGGRRSWWPTRPERLRRALEAQGHFVVFVNEVDHAA